MLEEDEEEEPSLTADSYLEAVVRRAGLLEERFHNRFAFWHPTFEEFFAAVSIATPSSETAARLLPLRTDPRWREVILLALGYIGIINHDQATATSILRSVLNDDPTPLEPIIHTNLLLTVDCIADDVGVRRGLVELVIQAFADLLPHQPYDPLVYSLKKLVQSRPWSRPGRVTVEALGSLARHESFVVRRDAARLLSNVARSDPKALSLCRELLGDRFQDVVVHAAIGLARCGDFSRTVCSALGRFDHDTQAPVAELLREEAAVTSMLGAEDTGLRVKTAKILIQQGRDEKRALEALGSALEAKEAWERFGAAQFLIERRWCEERAFETLVPMLEAEHALLRIAAARLLVEQGRGDDRAVETLISVLGDRQSWRRYEAAQYLLGSRWADERVFDALVSALETENAWIRVGAAEILIKRDRADERVFTTLVSALGAEDPGVRTKAAETLIEQDWDRERALEALVSALGAEDADVRLSVARKLLELGRTDERIFKALGSLLDAEDVGIRFEASLVLIERHRVDECVIEALISTLGATNEHWFLSADPRTTLKHLWVDQRVFEALVTALEADSPRLRVESARVLIEQGWTDARASEALVSALGAHEAATHLESLERFLEGAVLRPQDGECLAQLASVGDGDDPALRSAREGFFDLIFEHGISSDS